MKTAIKPKHFDLRTALYSLRRVYWHNVFRIDQLKGMPWNTRGRVLELRYANEWILKQIKGIQRQFNP